MLKTTVFTLSALPLLLACHVAAEDKKPLVAVCDIETSGLVLPDSAIDRLSDRLAARLSTTQKVQVVDRKLTNAPGVPDHGPDPYSFSQDQGCLASFLAARGHVIFMKRAATFEDYLVVADKIFESPKVASIVPFVLNEAIVSNDMGFSSVVLEGVDPASVSFLAGRVKSKKTKLPGLYIGRELAHRLNVREGESVHLISPLNMQKGADGVHPKTKSFEIVGVFFTGMYETDDKMAFVSLEDAQTFFEIKKGVTGLRVDFNDLADAVHHSEELIGTLGGYPYFAVTWLKMNRHLFEEMSAQPTGKNVLSDLVVITQARKRGAKCTLNVAVYDRRKIRITRSVVSQTTCTEQGIAKSLDSIAQVF